MPTVANNERKKWPNVIRRHIFRHKRAMMKKSYSSRKKKSFSDNDGVMKLSLKQQLAFWKELNKTLKLTPAQRQLGAIMRGEA